MGNPAIFEFGLVLLRGYQQAIELELWCNLPEFFGLASAVNGSVDLPKPS
jgi:hypothetical protein